MILFIDTRDSYNLTVGFGKKHITTQTTLSKSQAVLPLADQLLQQQQKTIADISEIIVKTGPGSFTGLRVGIAIANAFGFTCGISINGKPAGVFVEPSYK